MTSRCPEQLFAELDAWSHRKDIYSVNDFLKEKDVAYADFELMADGCEKSMQIWEVAASRAWDNLCEALHTQSLPRDKIAEYIRESDLEGDPEEIMHTLEAGKAQLKLYEMALHVDDSDVTELIEASVMRGVITEGQYTKFLDIKKEYPIAYPEDDEDLNDLSRQVQ
jgi:hypothetical protein